MFNWISWQQSKANKPLVSTLRVGHTGEKGYETGRWHRSRAGPAWRSEAEREVAALRVRVLLDCSAQTSWHITKIEILKSNLNNVQKRSCGVQHPVDLVVPNAEPRVATVLASQGMGLYVFLAL